jgi:hypothetical protein
MILIGRLGQVSVCACATAQMSIAAAASMIRDGRMGLIPPVLVVLAMLSMRLRHLIGIWSAIVLVCGNSHESRNENSLLMQSGRLVGLPAAGCLRHRIDRHYQQPGAAQ